jgi:hypothetical protein
MVVRNWLVTIEGTPADRTPLQVSTYPPAGADQVYQNAVVKVFFSKPVKGLDSRNFALMDARGSLVPAWVDQIGDGTWGLFPDQVKLRGSESYTAILKAGVCDLTGNCTRKDIVWRFVVSKDAGQGRGNTDIPMGFAAPGTARPSRSLARVSPIRRHEPANSDGMASSSRPKGQ